MDFAFKLKGFAADAATALNRAKQFTEERLGHSDRTEFDGYVENQLDRATSICTMTSKIVSACVGLLEPNVSSRVEDFLIEKKLVVQEKKRERLRNLEWLGHEMVQGGSTLSTGDLYAKALVTSGETQNKLGEFERIFATEATKAFIKPLKKFLDEDGKALTRERRVLEAKRLDLDAAKNRFKKIKPNDQVQTSNQAFNQVVKDIDQAEEQLREAQLAFDKQIEVVTAICDKIINSTSEHVKYLSKFMELQADYYKSANAYLDEILNNTSIDKQNSNPSSTSGAPTTFAALGFATEIE